MQTNFLIKAETWTGHRLQGRRNIQGLQISIENRKGSVRKGVDKDGHKWSIIMAASYGRICGAIGADGGLLDCYIGPDPESARVFIIHQNDPITGNYDEDKVMLGFNSAKEAKELYMKQYDRPGFFGSMDETDIETFKHKAFSDNAKGHRLTIKALMGGTRYRLLKARNPKLVQKIVTVHSPDGVFQRRAWVLPEDLHNERQKLAQFDLFDSDDSSLQKEKGEAGEAVASREPHGGDDRPGEDIKDTATFQFDGDTKTVKITIKNKPASLFTNTGKTKQAKVISVYGSGSKDVPEWTHEVAGNEVVTLDWVKYIHKKMVARNHITKTDSAEAQKGKAPILGIEDMRVFTPRKERPNDIPADWIILSNTEEPLEGNKTWEDNSEAYKFFAAINPNDENAKEILQHDKQKKAVIADYPDKNRIEEEKKVLIEEYPNLRDVIESSPDWPIHSQFERPGEWPRWNEYTEMMKHKPQLPEENKVNEDLFCVDNSYYRAINKYPGEYGVKLYKQANKELAKIRPKLYQEAVDLATNHSYETERRNYGGGHFYTWASVKIGDRYHSLDSWSASHYPMEARIFEIAKILAKQKSEKKEQGGNTIMGKVEKSVQQINHGRKMSFNAWIKDVTDRIYGAYCDLGLSSSERRLFDAEVDRILADELDAKDGKSVRNGTAKELKPDADKKLVAEMKKMYPEEFAVGAKVEMEHADDPCIAETIAAQHLSENGEYYKRLLNAGLIEEPKALREAREMGLTKSFGFVIRKALPDKGGVEYAHKAPPKGYPEAKKQYADPENYKYPLDTEQHVRAAIAYFSKPKNYSMYSRDERRAMWNRIIRAAKRFGIEVANEDKFKV